MSVMGAPQQQQTPFDRWPHAARYLVVAGALIVLLMIWQLLQTGTL